MVKRKGVKNYFERGDDEDEAEALRMFSAGLQSRRPRWRYDRIDWKNHVEQLRYTNKFQSRYHLTEESFDKLVGILRDEIKIDEKQSMCSTSGMNPITPEMVVGAGLRFLGGELHKSIAEGVANLRKSLRFSFYDGILLIDSSLVHVIGSMGPGASFFLFLSLWLILLRRFTDSSETFTSSSVA